MINIVIDIVLGALIAYVSFTFGYLKGYKNGGEYVVKQLEDDYLIRRRKK